jgi:heat shock protein HslJ
MEEFMYYVKPVSLCMGILAVFFAAACSGQKPAVQAGQIEESSPGDLMGVEWLLLEIRENGKSIILDRNKLEADQMGAAFSLRFENERVSGTAWPNRYSAECSWGEGGAVSFGPAAATQMAAFREPEALKENEFFRYFGEIRRWQLGNGLLELYAGEAVLIFKRE